MLSWGQERLEASPYNWATSFGIPGLYALVSRDDFLSPQASYDSSQIQVTGTIFETDNPDGTVDVKGAIKYSNLPLEVWISDASANPVTKILDGGTATANFNFRMTIAHPGDPISIDSMFTNSSLAMTFEGKGTAYGMGVGGYAAGQKVSVGIHQKGWTTPGNPHSALQDGFPVERIDLR